MSFFNFHSKLKRKGLDNLKFKMGKTKTKNKNKNKNNVHALKMSKFFSFKFSQNFLKTQPSHRRTKNLKIFEMENVERGNKSLKTNWKFNILIFSSS